MEMYLRLNQLNSKKNNATHIKITCSLLHAGYIGFCEGTLVEIRRFNH